MSGVRSTSKGSLTENGNLIGLLIFQHKSQKPSKSDQTISFAIAQYSNGKGRGWCARLENGIIDLPQLVIKLTVAVATNY